MQTLIVLLTVADVMIALLLVALVLMQQSKEGAFGSPFGGVGESVFGAQATSHLAKMTVVFAAMFLVLTLLLAIIIGHRKQPASVIEREIAIEEKTVEKKPAGTVVPSGEIKTEEVVKTETVPGPVAEKTETTPPEKKNE